MWRRLLSYLIPVTIYRETSEVSKSLEVTWNNGKLVLDSERTNYSYGSLQRTLRTGLRAIGYEKIRPMREILVLGVAAGSVIKTLVDEIGTQAQITGVDIDPNIIALARRFFRLDAVPNLELVIADANKFTSETKKRYDLIVVDVFEDTHMPEFLYESTFVNNLKLLLNQNGVIMFNSMILNEHSQNKNAGFLAHFAPPFFTARKLSRIESHNELLLIEKRKDALSSK